MPPRRGDLIGPIIDSHCGDPTRWLGCRSLDALPLSPYAPFVQILSVSALNEERQRTWWVRRQIEWLAAGAGTGRSWQHAYSCRVQTEQHTFASNVSVTRFVETRVALYY